MLSCTSIQLGGVQLCLLRHFASTITPPFACRPAASPGSYAAAASRSLRTRAAEGSSAAGAGATAAAQRTDAAASTSGRDVEGEPRLTFYFRGDPLPQGSTIFQVGWAVPVRSLALASSWLHRLARHLRSASECGVCVLATSGACTAGVRWQFNMRSRLLPYANLSLCVHAAC